MQIFNEDQILKDDFRKNVIEEIEGPENLTRKAESKKRYEVFKDNTKPYVLAMLDAESGDKKAVSEAVNRAGNVSFTREMIEKKSMVYKDPVIRIATDDNEQSQNQVDELSNILNINTKMKKTNKYNELFKNALVTVLPYESPSEIGKYRLMVNCLQPYLYDVIEDAVNPEIGRVFIFSYYNTQKQANSALPNQAGNREAPRPLSPMTKGDGIDQKIADSPNDKGSDKKEYIWWSNKYHFTTDEKGLIIPGRQDESLANPIGRLPMYNFSNDQDGQFWAIGGDDIVDGGILLNLLLTDLFYIAKYQGMGIGYCFGKGVPKNMKVGPAAFISLEMQEGDPTPSMGFATSNPPIAAHLQMIKDYLIFLLLTNKLSPDMADASLSVSGVHEMVKQSQNIADIEDQREVYRDGEPVLFKIIFAWLNLYQSKNLLDEEFKEIGKVKEDVKVKIKFEDAQPFVSEKEKLEVLEKRLQLELDTRLDIIKKDNPDLNDDEAKKKLATILKEKLKESSKRLRQLASGARDNMNDDNDDDLEQDNG